MQKFIHITDPHFVPPGTLLYDLNPLDRLALCVGDVNKHHPDASFAILTGDLAHKGQPEAYEALKRELDKLAMPYHLLVGNHDDRSNFRATFPAAKFDANGFVQYKFEMGEGVLGFDEVNMSQSIKQHTNGDWGTTITVTSTVTTEGQSTLPISFTGSSKTWNVGDVFTIANVYAVNPQTRESTGSLQQFTVTAAATGSSTATLSIFPALYSASQALATVSALPASGAAVTMVGSATGQYAQNLVYHKDAITFATADLLTPQGVDMASRQVHNGISMRIVRQYDINNDRLPCRIDVLYGYSAIRPQMAARIWG